MMDISEVLSAFDTDYYLIARIQQEKWVQMVTRHPDHNRVREMLTYAELHLSKPAWLALMLSGLTRDDRSTDRWSLYPLGVR